MMKPKGIRKYFVPQKDPKELVRKWQSSLRSETRAVEKQIRDINREKKKAEQAVREAAKRGDMNSVRILAKELVQTNRTINQLHSNRAHIMSMQVALSEQLAVVRVSGTIQKSTDIMESIAKLIKVPEMMKISQELAKEMEKAGLIEEMVSDAFESALDEEDLEEETEAEVLKVMAEIAGEIQNLPAAKRPVAVEAAPEPEPEEEEDLEVEALKSRLDAIRN